MLQLLGVFLWGNLFKRTPFFHTRIKRYFVVQNIIRRRSSYKCCKFTDRTFQVRSRLFPRSRHCHSTWLGRRSRRHVGRIACNQQTTTASHQRQGNCHASQPLHTTDVWVRQLYWLYIANALSSMPWRCWLTWSADRKGIWPVKILHPNKFFFFGGGTRGDLA